MTTQKRLRDVERGLTVKEIVLLHIEEYRRFPTMVAFARSLARVRHLPDTICSRIEQAIERAHKGKTKVELNRLVRAAQRDGLFLAKLARECNATIALGERERDLESALLWALLALSLHDRGGADERPGLPEWCEKAQAVRDRWADALAAVRLIEREYFDGAPVLYPEAESNLRTLIDGIGTMMERVGTLLDERVTTGQRSAPRARAAGQRPGAGRRPSPSPAVRREARRLVMSTKVLVLREFDQSDEAEAILDELIAEEV